MWMFFAVSDCFWEAVPTLIIYKPHWYASRAQWRRNPLKIAGPGPESPKSQAPAGACTNFQPSTYKLKNVDGASWAPEFMILGTVLKTKIGSKLTEIHSFSWKLGRTGETGEKWGGGAKILFWVCRDTRKCSTDERCARFLRFFWRFDHSNRIRIAKVTFILLRGGLPKTGETGETGELSGINL